MLNEEAFEGWCLQHHLSEQAKTVVQRIRSCPPSRLVRGAAGNVSGRYPSKKMGCTIQFESHRGELAFMYQLEHDAHGMRNELTASKQSGSRSFARGIPGFCMEVERLSLESRASEVTRIA